MINKEAIVKNLLIFAKESKLEDGKVILSMVSDDEQITKDNTIYKVMVFTIGDSFLSLEYKALLLEYCIKQDISKYLVIDYEWNLRDQSSIALFITDTIGENIMIRYNGRVILTTTNIKYF